MQKGLECLLTFEKLDLYYGINWKKEFKSPTDFCFGLKVKYLYLHQL